MTLDQQIKLAKLDLEFAKNSRRKHRINKCVHRYVSLLKLKRKQQYLKNMKNETENCK